ncbi:MAG: SGNH/GDSL hydrolase family protein [Muribaculaceae bacterium]|nr:SGNH/GDSL hydrolase family protein [Muribaculaceae bacterium]
MRQFLLFMAAWLSMSIMAQPDWAGLRRYESANAQLREHVAARGVKVVFMGNSITEHWMELHPEFFTANGFVGRGISGQTSSQMLVRFRQDVVDLHPKVVVINAGTNDIAENTGAYSQQATLGHIISMVELAQASKIKVIMTSVLPTSQFPWNPSVTDVTGKVERLNAELSAYAAKHKIPFVDYYSAMVSTGKALNSAYSDDGVHPTVAGYAVMEPLVLKAISKFVKK